MAPVKERLLTAGRFNSPSPDLIRWILYKAKTKADDGTPRWTYSEIAEHASRSTLKIQVRPSQASYITRRHDYETFLWRKEHNPRWRGNGAEDAPSYAFNFKSYPESPRGDLAIYESLNSNLPPRELEPDEKLSTAKVRRARAGRFGDPIYAEYHDDGCSYFETGGLDECDCGMKEVLS